MNATKILSLTSSIVRRSTLQKMRTSRIALWSHLDDSFSFSSFSLSFSCNNKNAWSSIESRGFHSSVPLLKKRKNKRAALANHDVKMEEIAHREVQEARKAAKASGRHNAVVDEVKETISNEDDDLSEDYHSDEEDEFISLPTKADVQKRMQRVIDSMIRAFKNIRGSEVSAEIFENIMVEAYGGVKTPLTSLAQVVVVSPTRVIMSPYDPAVATAVRDAVRDAPDLTFNPLVENGEVVVPVPKVSQETRAQLSKQVGRMAEENRKRVRGIRKSFQDKAKRGKEAGFSEDEVFRCSKEVDAVTEEIITSLNEIADEKQASVMKV